MRLIDSCIAQLKSEAKEDTINIRIKTLDDSKSWEVGLLNPLR